jgi:hypothetical protein
MSIAEQEPMQALPAGEQPAFEDSLPQRVRELINQGFTELDARLEDGIHTHLLWHGETKELLVTVDDDKTNEAYNLRPDGSEAFDVLHHPFAYVSKLGELSIVQ